MDLLLIIGIAVIVLALLGFMGVLAALRGAAWLILIMGLGILAVSFFFF